MSYVAPEIVQKVKQMDLLTYLKNYEPYELVHFSGNTYTTRTHDSLKISNGKWMWWSRGIGGRSALDYLIKVKGYDFVEAVQTIAGQAAIQPPFSVDTEKKTERKLILPKPYLNERYAVSYLERRGIDREIIQFCVETGRIYESERYHMWSLWEWIQKGNPVMRPCVVWKQTLLERQPGVTKIILSAFRQKRQARLYTCMSRQSTCYRMPQSES